VLGFQNDIQNQVCLLMIAFSLDDDDWTRAILHDVVADAAQQNLRERRLAMRTDEKHVRHLSCGDLRQKLSRTSHFDDAPDRYISRLNNAS